MRNPADAEARGSEYSQEFIEFWDAYPEHKGKRAAWKAWKQAVKRAEPSEIIAGARAYSAWCLANPAVRKKYPQGWLNADRWEDTLSHENVSMGSSDFLRMAGEDLQRGVAS